MVAEGTVVEVGGHYRLTLEVKPTTELAGVTRVFESTSCDGLAGAAAVTLALLARGEAGTDGPASSAPPPVSSSVPSPQSSSTASPAPTSGTSSGPSPGLAASSPAQSEAPTRATPDVETPLPPVPQSPLKPTDAARDQEQTVAARWSPTLQLPILISDAGVLPSAGYGLGLGVGIRVRKLQVMLSGVMWLSQGAIGASPYAATYQRRTGELSGCYSWQYGHFEGGPCLMMTLEDVTADGSGTDVTDSHGHVSWLAAGLGVRAGVSPSRLVTLFLRPSASFTTSRPTFAIDGFGPLYKVPLAAVGVEMGSEWIF